MNHYEIERYKNGEQMPTKSAVIKDDKFDKLWVDKTQDPARVAITVGHSIEYGYIKVSATVSLACDQNEQQIDKAGELAFYKAHELAQDSMAEVVSYQEQFNKEKKG